MPNKALSPSLCLSFFSEKGCLKWTLQPLVTPDPSVPPLLGFWPTIPTLACSVGVGHSNQQSSEAELPFWKFKVAGLLPVNL